MFIYVDQTFGSGKRGEKGLGSGAKFLAFLDVITSLSCNKVITPPRCLDDLSTTTTTTPDCPNVRRNAQDDTNNQGYPVEGQENGTTNAGEVPQRYEVIRPRPQHRSIESDRHQGQMGRIAVIGGSEDYTGAPYFSAMASARLGADMVRQPILNYPSID